LSKGVLAISSKLLVFISLIWSAVLITAIFHNQPKVIDAGYIGAALFWLIAPPFVFFSILKYVMWIVRAFKAKTKKE